jgi:hypothetical protein
VENRRRRKAIEWTADFLENCKLLQAAEPRRPRPAAIAAPGGNPAYVAAAIRAELQRLADATEGTRNDTLHKVACRVFEFVKGGHADQNAAHAELERIATAIGLELREIHATIKSAWNRVGPRDVPAGGAA